MRQIGDDPSDRLRERYLAPILSPQCLEQLPKKYEVDDILQVAGCKETRRMVTDILAGKPTHDLEIPQENRLNFLNGWLRFVTGDSPVARMRWAALANDPELSDRDEVAWKLWRMTSGQGPEAKLKEQAEERWCPWSYYERHFFGWFLSRFELGRARGIYADTRLVRNWHFLLAFVAVLIGGLVLGLLPATNSGVFALSAWLALALGAGFFFYFKNKLPWFAYIHSLIPRLAFGVGIGYLFLASAPGLLKIVYESARDPWELWTASGLLVLAAFVYIALHIDRRVHPSLKWRSLLQRTLGVWSLGVGYAALLLLPIATLLFSASLLYPPYITVLPKGPAGVQHFALSAAVALNIGVILQLAWEEKPLTEPL